MDSIPIDLYFNIYTFLNNNEILQFKLCNSDSICIINSYKKNKYIYKVENNSNDNEYKKRLKINWRIRYKKYTELNICRKYSHYRLMEIKAKKYNLRYNVFHANRKSVLSSKWEIYDDNKLLAYIKKKKNKWILYRLDNTEWCNFLIKNGCKKPRSIKIQNIKNKEYENPIENQYNVIYENEIPIFNGKHYNIKFNSNKIKLASIKNCKLLCPITESTIFEFGKTQNKNFVLGYKYPLHGLLAFALSIVLLDF